MRKIIVAYDGSHFSEGAFEFLRRLNENEPILATGIFLPKIDYTELLYSLGGISGPVYYQDVVHEDEAIQKNIAHFKSLCAINNIDHRIHNDTEKHVISELKLESRYADLLVLSSELFYENLGQNNQDEYIAEVLHKAECPVVLVPEHFNYPENIVLAYDGSASSVYAIKQFTYLLPQLNNLKTLLITAGQKDENGQGITNMEELAARHFKDLTVSHLDINAKKYFNTWLEDNGKTFLVCGAYARSPLSELLKKSFITETIHDHKVPVFIAHK